jgi:hypothetical protein
VLSFWRQLKICVDVGESIRCRVCGNKCFLQHPHKRVRHPSAMIPTRCPAFSRSDLLERLCKRKNAAQWQAVTDGAALSFKDERVSSRKVHVCWCVLRDRHGKMPSVRRPFSVWPGLQHRPLCNNSLLSPVSLGCLTSMQRLLFSSTPLMQSAVTLSTQCVGVFRMILKVKSDYFHK